MLVGTTCRGGKTALRGTRISEQGACYNCPNSLHAVPAMPRRHRLLLAAVAAVLAMSPNRTAPPAGLDDATAAAVALTVRPAPGEDVFATIPWQTSVHEARRLAATQGKPILLWEMDGHPLGCG